MSLTTLLIVAIIYVLLVALYFFPIKFENRWNWKRFGEDFQTRYMEIWRMYGYVLEYIFMAFFLTAIIKISLTMSGFDVSSRFILAGVLVFYAIGFRWVTHDVPDSTQFVFVDKLFSKTMDEGQTRVIIFNAGSCLVSWHFQQQGDISLKRTIILKIIQQLDTVLDEVLEISCTIIAEVDPLNSKRHALLGKNQDEREEAVRSALEESIRGVNETFFAEEGKRVDEIFGILGDIRSRVQAKQRDAVNGLRDTLGIRIKTYELGEISRSTEGREIKKETYAYRQRSVLAFNQRFADPITGIINRDGDGKPIARDGAMTEKECWSTLMAATDPSSHLNTDWKTWSLDALPPEVAEFVTGLITKYLDKGGSD